MRPPLFTEEVTVFYVPGARLATTSPRVKIPQFALSALKKKRKEKRKFVMNYIPARDFPWLTDDRSHVFLVLLCRL